MDARLPLIMINNVDFTYPNGTVALKKINLNIYKGEIIGIMGMNGAGKTTLIRTLNGLIRPSNGNIYLNGKINKTESIGKLSKIVGIIFQNPHHQVFSNTVEEEIKFSLKSSKRVYIIEKGEIQYEGSVESLRENESIMKKYLAV